MRDEDFEGFIEEFGEASQRFDVPDVSIARWTGKLPNVLLAYWKEEGWSSYADGLIWTVDPDEYEDIKDAWLENTLFSTIDSFHVIARSAFGNLYLCGEKTGRNVNINCANNTIMAMSKDLKPIQPHYLDISVQSFFGINEPDDFDFFDANNRPIFKRAMKKYGPLEPDEMYGFEPALVLGGERILENLRRVKLDQHLHILRAFSAPDVDIIGLDPDKLK